MMLSLFRRELKLALRHRDDMLTPLCFFLIVCTLFPLGIGPEPGLLQHTAAGIVWIAALLASLLAMGRLFRDDFIDGSLDLLRLLPLPFPSVVLVKVLVHWIVTGVPLLMLSPLIAVLFGMSLTGWKALALTLLLGTPTLSFIGAIGVGLTVGLTRSSLLVSLLVLPMMVPLLIFTTATVESAQQHLPIGSQLATLGAFLSASATLSPFATAAALKLNLE